MLDHRKSRRIPEIYLLLLYWPSKAFDSVDHNKLWKTYWDWNTRPSYLPSEKSVCKSRSNRTEHERADWFQIRKGIIKGCISSPCLFKFYAEYIMRNVELDEGQAGIMVAGRNINNLKYADDTTLMAECEEKLKSLLMKVKEESETSGLNSTFRKWRSWHFVPSLHGK